MGRPTISKLLSHAKDRGFVHVEVRDPRENDQRLSAQLCEIYGLNSVHSVRFFWRRTREVDANGAPANKRTYEPCIPLKTFQLGTYVPKNPVETSMPRPNIGCERGTKASFTADHRYPVKSHESSQNV